MRRLIIIASKYGVKFKKKCQKLQLNRIHLSFCFVQLMLMGRLKT
jgi:hypothetical protein